MNSRRMADASTKEQAPANQAKLLTCHLRKQIPIVFQFQRPFCFGGEEAFGALVSNRLT